MKTILIILDGASEEKIKELNNMTPLEFANTPALDKLIKMGKQDRRKFFPHNRMPDSLCCILSILGVDESLIPENRAYLELLAAGIEIDNSEVALRCNLVSIENNKLSSFNGQGLSAEQMSEYSKKVITDNKLKFYHISDYRNILVINKNMMEYKLKNMPPHENVGEPIEKLLSNIKDHALNGFIRQNQFSLNKKDYMFYPWGVSKKTKLPSFYELHKKSCSCVCKAEILKGICKSMEIALPKLNYATADVNTSLKEKANAVLNEIKHYDLVIAHINGTDEVSHRKDIMGKVKFIEKIDKEFISLVIENVKNTKVIVLSDHQTSSVTGNHEKGFVDIIETIIKE